MAEPAIKVVRERILQEMLATVGKDETDIGAGWKVLILDDVTTKVVSSALKMSDILDCQVSVVEDLHKSREPLSMHAVYFVAPKVESVAKVVQDFGKHPLYPAVHIFFSSRVSGNIIELIKKSTNLTARLRTMKEANIEFVTVDSHTFITDTPQALTVLMGERADTAKAEVDATMEQIVSRLCSFFTTLKEFPTIRYKVGKPPEEGDAPGAAARAMLCQRVATKLSDRLVAMQRSSLLPERETCDLLVLDRSYDPIAPIIHDWSYEAMAYDLLDIEGNVYSYESQTNGGKQELKQSPLDESDELWCRLRHQFFPDVLTTIRALVQELSAKNSVVGNVKGGADIRKILSTMPGFEADKSRASLQTNMASEMKKLLETRKLAEVSAMEQDLVFGEKNSKDLIRFLMEPSNASVQTEDKMRLFMCYLATHPHKLDSAVRTNWMKVARLSADDMNAVANLSFLNVMVSKSPTAAKTSYFGSAAKPEKNLRKLREGKDENLLTRFEPLLVEILEDWGKAKLPQEQFPYVRQPQEDPAAHSGGKGASARTNRTGLWTNKKQTPEADKTVATTGGRRLIVLVIGGACRSEMRAVHQLSQQLGRDVLLLSTNIDTPTSFLDNLKKINSSYLQDRVEA